MGTGERTIFALWAAIEAREWERVESLCSPTCTFSLPQSGELYDRSGYVRLNREYPGEWHLKVTRLVEGDAWVVTEVEVATTDRVDHGITFFRVVDGLVMEIREFWPEAFVVPEWRAAWSHT